MPTIKMKVTNNQSWIDIAIIQAGDATAVIEYALLNNCDFTAVMENKQQLQPIKKVYNKEVQTYFNFSKMKPATELSKEITELYTDSMQLEYTYTIV